MKYTNYQRNHVILPGREDALEAFLKSKFHGKNHKWQNGFSSNSEDALTWSYFDILKNLSLENKLKALDEIIEDSFQTETKDFLYRNSGYSLDDIQVECGEEFRGPTTKEATEVDAYVELPNKLIFFEAKLYSSISLADPNKNKPHDQIIRKLRVGLDYAAHQHPLKEFYFIFIDIAPANELLKFSPDKCLENALKNTKGKWKSAWWYKYYKYGRNKSMKPLKTQLEDITHDSVEAVAKNMGWLTWTDLSKIVMRGMIKNYISRELENNFIICESE